MARNTDLLTHHKKSTAKRRKHFEDRIEAGLPPEVEVDYSKKEKPQIKLSEEMALLAKQHRVDPLVHGTSTESLIQFFEEEKRLKLEKQAFLDSGGVIPPPARQLGYNKEAKPLEEKWKRKEFGSDGKLEDVNIAAARTELKARYENVAHAANPFYDCSVRDNLEQNHWDGFHSQVTPPVEAPTELPMTAARRAIAPMREVNFIEACKAIPGSDELLNAVSIEESKNRYGKIPKVTRSPWGEYYEYSSFTKDGTYLTEFKKDFLERDIDKALAKHIDYLKATSVQVEGYDPVLVAKLGGDEKVAKMGEKIVKYNETIKKKGRFTSHGALVDFKSDLIEACNRLNLSQVIALFFRGDADPDTLMSDQEPLFTHMIQKLLGMDNMNGSGLIGSPDTPERVKMMKIMDLFVKYEVKINVHRLNGHGSLHLAAQVGNTKVIKWLLDNGANPRDRSDREQMTPLMFACRYGQVAAMSELIRACGVACLSEVDTKGFTPLHFCASMGQTRACVFLLDINSNKRALDHQNRTAARVAQDNGHVATSQAISCHAYAPVKGQVYLDFIDKQLKPDEEEEQKFSFFGGLKEFGAQLWNAASGAGHAAGKQLAKGLLNLRDYLLTPNSRKTGQGQISKSSPSILSFMARLVGLGGGKESKVAPAPVEDGLVLAYPISSPDDGYQVRPFDAD